MNIGPPPTDSLYKFMALSGLAIMLAAVFATTQGFNSLLSRADEITSVAIDVEADLRLLELEVVRLEKRTDRPESISALQKDQIQREMVTLEKRLNESKRRRDQVMRMFDRYISDLSFHRRMMFAYALFLIGGVLLMWRGFHLWYHRLQKHLDRRVEREANG